VDDKRGDLKGQGKKFDVKDSALKVQTPFVEIRITEGISGNKRGRGGTETGKGQLRGPASRAWRFPA